MPTAGLAEEKKLTEKRVNRNGGDMRMKGETQIQRTEAFIRNTIAGKELLNNKPFALFLGVYVWELQAWGVEEPNMSSGSAERHARTLRRQGILEHPITDGMVNKHAYVVAELQFEEIGCKEVEQYPTIPSHAEELQEEIHWERVDRKISDLQKEVDVPVQLFAGLLKTKSLF